MAFYKPTEKSHSQSGSLRGQFTQIINFINTNFLTIICAKVLL